jgi:hypothetical protein
MLVNRNSRGSKSTDNKWQKKMCLPPPFQSAVHITEKKFSAAAKKLPRRKTHARQQQNAANTLVFYSFGYWKTTD